MTESKESFVDKFIDTYWGNEMEKGKLMQVSLWRMKREIQSNESFGEYKVKVYHMDDDEFRVKLYP